MLRLQGAAIELALLPLISGNIQVSRIVLSKPNILLEQYADGTNNWTFAPANGETAEAGTSEPGAGNGFEAPPVRLDDVVIQGGTLVFRNPDTAERVEDINVSLGAGSLAGPFRADGTVRARGFAVGVNAAVCLLYTSDAADE